MAMDERKMKILRAIIQDYIATAEPIGSRTIARKFDLGVSSATIRNEMADLEELGLLEQPHTSAGRIPSDAGYRYYVDRLMEPSELAEDLEIPIKEAMSNKIMEIKDVVAQTSKFLSQFTSLTGIVLTPQLSKGTSRFYQMHFLNFQPGKAIMVIGKEDGSVEHHVIDVGENATLGELQQMAEVFNQRLRGRSFDQIRRTLLHEIYNEVSKQRRLLDNAMDLLGLMLEETEEKEQVFVGGTLNMLNQPEFRDLDKVKNLFTMLEENSNLVKLFNIGRDKQLSITIGQENVLQEFKHCSLVSASYKVNGEIVGSVGVLGPTRMDYDKVVAIVGFMTKTLSEILSRGQNMH